MLQMIDGSFTEFEKGLLPPSPCAMPVSDLDDSFDTLWNDVEDISCISGKPEGKFVKLYKILGVLGA